MKVVWSEQAGKSLRVTAAYVRSKFGAQAKQNLLKEVAQTALLLESSPYMGIVEPLLEGCEVEYRSIVVNKLNKIIYYISAGSVEITAFWDTRREPQRQAEEMINRQTFD